VAKGGYGINGYSIKKIPRLGDGLYGRVIRTRKPTAIYDIDKDLKVKDRESIKLEKDVFRSLVSVPVIFQDRVLGVISAYSKKLRHFKDEEIEVLSIFASHVAIAIQESRYYEDLHTNYFNTMHTLVLAIEARDPYTRGHTERVTKYALEVARVLNMPHRELEILRYAGEVHDVGKISVPDSILNKPGILTRAERAIVEIHPIKGVEMLEPLEFLRPALPIVKHHHERYDGTGYPDGLEKEKIPLMSRILACADAFDAMTSERPYRREKLSIEEALAEIKNNAGSQFDPHITYLFIKTIRAQNPLKIKALQ
jgi:HD-GYP domain-containing protein (c-di-GMP phosphodiesterase class II)